jgi:hypothetical protein
MEAEIFESSAERDRGERGIQDSEAALQKYVSRVGISGAKLSKNGRKLLEQFLQLNLYLLNLKKVRHLSFVV